MIENEEIDSIKEFIKVDHESLQNLRKSLIDDKCNAYKVYVRLQPTCLLKRVRLFIIFRALSEIGQICFTNPDTHALESGEFKLDFEVYLISQKEDKEILSMLDEILEIENKYIITKSKDEFLIACSEIISSGSVTNDLEIDNDVRGEKLVKEHRERLLSDDALRDEGEGTDSFVKGEPSKDQFSNITDIQKDALKEIGNIGAGNAANALAGLLDRRVDINIPSVQVIDLDEYITNVTKNNFKHFITWSNISGDNKATVMILFKISEVLKLVSLMVEGMIDFNTKLSEDNINSITDLPELYTSALSELGHILANHYSIALGNLLELKLMTDPPGMSLDVGNQLQETVHQKVGLYKGLNLLIITTIMIKDLMVSGSCIFIPDPTTLDKMLNALSQFL